MVVRRRDMRTYGIKKAGSSINCAFVKMLSTKKFDELSRGLSGFLSVATRASLTHLSCSTNKQWASI